ncbi:hypothetical protein QBZ16_001395 [Prototheca wickerhamii]|uniref:Uncharacterized protein n=1 Tax=Prototheca wickerhamii TaxID=3111 RepID=A0AAD9IFA6_PROWI|nr:hypothetical protein QBZ16_001395 [Prototheca wickerhamii]
MFKKLFGNPKAVNGPTVSSTTTTRTVDAIHKLTETEELLVKRRDVLDKKIAIELERARELTRTKNKRGALMALKKKKMYEQQREQLENQILRVSEQQMMLENQRTVVETVDAMRTAATASKRVMTEMKIDDVDKVLDSINEQTEDMRQIQDALGNPIGAAMDLDEDELLGELEELEASELDEQLLEPAAVSAGPARVPQAAAALPAAPARRPAAPAKTPEELELEELQAELAAA